MSASRFQFSLRNFSALILCTASFAFYSLSTCANPLAIVDQENSSFPDLVSSVFTAADPARAQTFTPSLSGLDAVELRLGDGGLITDGLGQELRVLIREGNPAGATVATSLPKVLSDGFFYGVIGGGIVHFDFPTTVPLTPGNVYSMQLVQTAGGPFEIYLVSNNPYAGGQPWVGTELWTPVTHDIWFGEGLHVPEPTISVLVLLAYAPLTMFRRRSRRPGNDAGK